MNWMNPAQLSCLKVSKDQATHILHMASRLLARRVNHFRNHFELTRRGRWKHRCESTKS